MNPLKILLAPKKFRGPRKMKFLVYDRTGSENLLPLLPREDSAVLDVRGESFHIPVLLRALIRNRLRLRGLSISYAVEYIRAADANAVITWIDNDLKYYSLKSSLPAVIFIMVQNGWRGGGADVFDLLQTLTKLPAGHVDHMFVYGEAIAREYEKYLTGLTICAGAFRANRQNFFPAGKPGGEIAFISQYHEGAVPFRTRILTNEEFYAADEMVLKFLAGYCREKNISLKIIMRNVFSRPEKQFFTGILEGTGVLWSAAETSGNVYGILGDFGMVATVDSTLGYEALSLGCRVGFFSVRSTLIGDEGFRFGWPGKIGESGPFWTGQNDPAEFRRVADYLLNAPAGEWEKTGSPVAEKLIVRDPDNSRLKSLLETL